MKKWIPPTLLLALSALFSRLLGVFRDHLLANTFGATTGTGVYNLDTYYAAFRVPDMLYNLLIFGAVSAAFIPIFTQYKQEKKLKEAWEFASNMLHVLLLLILSVSVLAWIFAPALTHLVAGGFNQESFNITVRLMRIMLISPILFTFSAVLISIQDSFKSFFFRSLGPLFYNLGIIFGILFFGAEFGVLGVTWGVILGALLQLLVQVPVFFLLKVKHVWILNTGREDLRKAFFLMVPRILGLSLMQITLLVNTFIASFLATGSITVFYLADNLQNLPLGIVGISFAITSFATLSELAMQKSPTAFAEEVQRVMQKILFLIIPATFGLLLLRAEIIDFILVGGKFTPEDARLTAQVLGVFLISLFAQSLIPLLSRGFYAYGDTKTPLLTALLGSLISIGGSFFLAFHLAFGIVGIAVAFSAGMILNFLLLYFFMSFKCRHLLLDGWNILKMVIAGTMMFTGTLFIKELVPYGGNFAEKTLSLGVLIGTGVLIYFILAVLLRIPERKIL